MTLEDATSEVLLYLKSVRGLSENTIISYGNDYAHALEYFDGERDVSTISLLDLRSCVAYLSAKKFSIPSINRFIASERTLFAYCKKFNYIKKNVALGLKSLRSPKSLPKFMTLNEVDELCALPEKKEILWETRDKALFEMLYSSGCRVSELISIKISDFSGDYSNVIVKGKGSKDRKVFFETDAQNALKLYLDDRKKHFPKLEENVLFLNQKGSPLTTQGVWYILNRYSGQEGTGRHISPHTFRHTFSTALLTNGADIRLVQEMLGHSSISTTQRYTHITTERLKEVYWKCFPHSGKNRN